MKYQAKIKECKTCKRCCHNTSNKIFSIRLTKSEQNTLKRRKIDFKPLSDCPYLTQKGCRLKIKPFICRYFPFFVKRLNRKVRVYFDSDCPIAETLSKSTDYIPIYNNMSKEFTNLSKSDQKEILKQYENK